MLLKNLEIITKKYELCLSNYLSARDLSWNTTLDMIKIEFELISDAEMCLFFKKCMRGGVF